MGYSHDDDIVTLTTGDGEEIDFVNIAGINYKGSFYAILQPVELLDGMDDDEALVFKVTRKGNGDANYAIELNDSIVDGVFNEYNKLLDKTHGKKLKKSGGMKKVFGTATKVAKKTIWLISLIIGILITLGGAFFILGGVLSGNEIIMYIIGGIALVIGLLWVTRTWRKRKK